MLTMILGRSSTPLASAIDVEERHHTANSQELTARLQAAAEISQHCQNQYRELHGLLQTLDVHLEEVHVLSARGVAPTQVSQARDVEVAALRQELEESRREREKLATELAERDRALRHVLQERDGLSKLLASRTAELDAAQAFLPGADTITDTHAIGLVQALNYEISQAATVLADSFEGEVRHLPISDELSVALAPSVKIIGKSITKTLSSPGEDHMLSLQIGLQASLVRFSKIEINRWSFGARSSFAATFASIKDAVKDAEPEHIAVRWSALSQKYAQVALDGDIEAEDIATLLAQQWADAVSLAGYCGDLTAADTTTLVESRAGSQLIDVAKLILELNKVFGQKVLRGWMYCIAARSNEVYDPVTMEMDFQGEDDGRQGEKYRVVGTTALGLQRSEGEEDVTLLKSKVAVVRAKTKRASR
ncbi:hypothetical protein PENSPDRAFT_747090 [Peniophora sp. CONT]|nr:hypothetical protein PENSPDRAFT_747090 [Peniophora sp. CONT]